MRLLQHARHAPTTYVTLLQHTSRSYNIRHAPTTLYHPPTTTSPNYNTPSPSYDSTSLLQTTSRSSYNTTSRFHNTTSRSYNTTSRSYNTTSRSSTTSHLQNHTNVPLVRTTAFPYTHHRSSATPLSQTNSVFPQSFFAQYSLLLFYHSHIPTLASLFFFHHTCKRTHCTGVQIRVIKDFSTSSNS